MTPTVSRSPRLLLTASVVLAVAGGVLLALPQSPHAPATATAPPVPAPTPHLSSLSGASADASEGNVPAGVPSASASTLPPPGEGTAGDRGIRTALEAAWPADLSPRDERQLLALGRALLDADTTGVGQARWPALFGGQGRAIAPAFARVRIQAAIARRDDADDRAVVHLVWAGTDRGGASTDGRITEWHFTRTTSKKGTSTWTSQPRT